MGLYNSLLSAYFECRLLLISIRTLFKQLLTGRHIQFDETGIECEGRVAIVTGGSRGIGFAAVKRLAKAGVHVIIAARNKVQGTKAVTEVKAEVPLAKIEFHELDLMSTISIKTFAEYFLSKGIPLHYLINNAGSLFPKQELTADGIESTLMTNFVGPFLLTSLLLPTLEKTGTSDCHARIINVSSEGHQILGNGKRKSHIDWKDLNGNNFYCQAHAYAQSKAFQVMHSYKLQRYFHANHSHVTAISLHPGFAYTNASRQLWTTPSGKILKAFGIDKIVKALMWTADQAADVVVCAALKPSLASRGILYLNNCQESESRRSLTYMGHHQDRLWQETCNMLGLDVDPDMLHWVEEVERVEKLFGVNQDEN